MTTEGIELTRSWVVVDENKCSETSGVQDVQENQPHGDSDSDSISVISESGCSYRTDEEDVIINSETNNTENESTLLEEQETKIDEINEAAISEKPLENDKIGMMLYFATSAVCAIILIGFSVAVQQYFQGSSTINNYKPEDSLKFVEKNNEFIKNEFTNNLKLKRKHRLSKESSEVYIEDNDLNVETTLKSNFKPSKNKISENKCHKENCNAKTDDNYDNRIKELKIKEEFLREKEKFLIEKEHDLLKKELKLKKNEIHDKFQQKSDEEHEHHKQNLKKNNYKGEKKIQKRYEGDKKRNMSGHWYMNLHEGRDSMRRNKRFGSKRTKAHWYFQWMVDRARLRAK